MRKMGIKTITAIAFLICSMAGVAHNGPVVQRAKYENFVYPVSVDRTAIPIGCSSHPFSHFFRCKRSERIELSLEREFWAYVQNTNYNGVKSLLPRIKSYAKKSNTRYKARLDRLVAFGNVMISQQSRGITLQEIPNLITARGFAEVSNQLQPGNAFTESITGFVDSQIGYALKSWRHGDSVINALLEQPGRHGEYGLEGEVVGAMSLTYTTDENRIRKGLHILNDCESYNCIRTSSIAPFKQVGVLMTIAEAYVALGQYADAEMSLLKAMHFARRHNMPPAMLRLVEQAKNEILGEKFKTESKRLKGIGYYRQPAGPSQGGKACSICHFGAVVPDYYYSWK